MECAAKAERGKSRCALHRRLSIQRRLKKNLLQGLKPDTVETPPMPKFEAHITLDKIHAVEARKVIDGNPFWVFSEITGCPILGQGAYCYLTSGGSNEHILLNQVKIIEAALKNLGVESLRSKIERIIYDTKTGVNEMYKERSDAQAISQEA